MKCQAEVTIEKRGSTIEKKRGIKICKTKKKKKKKRTIEKQKLISKMKKRMRKTINERLKKEKSNESEYLKERNK